jgi:hypothetical protein
MDDALRLLGVHLLEGSGRDELHIDAVGTEQRQVLFGGGGDHLGRQVRSAGAVRPPTGEKKRLVGVQLGGGADMSVNVDDGHRGLPFVAGSNLVATPVLNRELTFRARAKVAAALAPSSNRRSVSGHDARRTEALRRALP